MLLAPTISGGSSLFNSVLVETKLDTASDVTTSPGTFYHTKIWSSSRLLQPNGILQGPDSRKLLVLGFFKASLSIAVTPSPQCSVYLICRLQQSSLGWPEIQALCLLNQLDTVSTDSISMNTAPYTAIAKHFSNTVLWIRKIQRPTTHDLFAWQCHTILTDSSLTDPSAVANELKWMEELEVIRKVDQPTDWCADMVIAPKANGNICTCCDFTQMNASVRRKRHILPPVQHLLASIQAQFFTKLDAFIGFHQIPLDESYNI